MAVTVGYRNSIQIENQNYGINTSSNTHKNIIFLTFKNIFELVLKVYDTIWMDSMNANITKQAKAILRSAVD